MYCTRRACSSALTTLMKYMVACVRDREKTTMAMWAFWFVQSDQSENRAPRYDDSEAEVLSLLPNHS